MDKNFNQKVEQNLQQAKQHFTKAVENAHKMLIEVKKQCEVEIKKMHPKEKEAFNSILNEWNQATTDLKKFATTTASEAKGTFLHAANNALTIASDLKQKAQEALKSVQPKTKETIQHAIGELKSAAEELKKAATSAWSGK